VLAESPAALEAYTTLWGIAEKTGFTAQERNIVYIAIIYENECTYCIAGHTNLSRMANVEPEAIAAVREGRPIADPKLEALRQFAANVTRNRGIVSEADVSAFKAAGYENRAMLDVGVLDRHLEKRMFVADESYSIADFPNPRRWFDLVRQRAGTQARGEPYSNRPTVTEEGKKLLFGQTARIASLA
jgi:AhpD family alkylhydroperoxidase